MKRNILLLVAAIVLFRASVSRSETIEPYSWVYRALRSFEANGLIHLEPTLPYSRDRVESYVRELSSRVENENIELGFRQRFLLYRLKQEFVGKDAEPENRDDRPLTVIREGNRFAALDASLGSAWLKGERSSRGEVDGLGAVEMLIDAGAGLHLQTQYRILMAPERGANVDGSHPTARTRSFRGLTGEFERGLLSVEGKGWQVSLGRDYLHWGGDPEESLILSRSAGSLDHIGCSIAIGRFALSAFYSVLGQTNGFLWSTGGDRDTVEYFLGRRLVGHRLTVSLPRGIFLGLSETVLYASSSVEWVYLMPVSILYVNQANERTNDDNILYSFDIKVPVIAGVLLSAELLVDDVQYERGEEAGPDRLAYSVMVEGRKLLGGRELGLAGRYTRVDIYTYEHGRIYCGANTSYVAGDGNYPTDALLGSSIGPDADRWDVSLYCGLSARFDLDIDASFLRRGEGNDLEEWEAGKNRNPPFPSGAVEKETRFSAGVSWDLRRGSIISATMGVRSLSGGENSTDRRDGFGRFEIIIDL